MYTATVSEPLHSLEVCVEASPLSLIQGQTIILQPRKKEWKN